VKFVFVVPPGGKRKEKSDKIISTSHHLGKERLWTCPRYSLYKSDMRMMTEKTLQDLNLSNKFGD